jgi:hypothetical protein
MNINKYFQSEDSFRKAVLETSFYIQSKNEDAFKSDLECMELNGLVVKKVLSFFENQDFSIKSFSKPIANDFLDPLNRIINYIREHSEYFRENPEIPHFIKEVSIKLKAYELNLELVRLLVGRIHRAKNDENIVLSESLSSFKTASYGAEIMESYNLNALLDLSGCFDHLGEDPLELAYKNFPEGKMKRKAKGMIRDLNLPIEMIQLLAKTDSVNIPKSELQALIKKKEETEDKSKIVFYELNRKRCLIKSYVFLVSHNRFLKFLKEEQKEILEERLLNSSKKTHSYSPVLLILINLLGLNQFKDYKPTTEEDVRSMIQNIFDEK